MVDDARLLQWRNLPMELRLKQHWLIAHPANKNPLFHNQGQFFNASVSKHLSAQWMTFEEATRLAITYNLAIGFVIKEGEEYTCIDLDVKPNTTKEVLDLYDSVVHSFDSYTERSVGGNGIHIWCKGSIGLGRRREGVEIYSQNRFMICTGNVLVFKEQLESRQEKLTNMVSQMGLSDDHNEIVLEELPQLESDEDIGRKLWEIEDSKMLWQGMWKELDHPSQSEGDLDLMVHLVRYTPSNEQCRRLFRQSGLGKRTKANRKDYIERTLRHARYIRQCEMVDIELGNRTREAILAKYDADQAALRATADGNVVHDYTSETVDYSFTVDTPPQEQEIENSQLGFPPGGLGYLAGYFYRGSVYPNVGFSVAAALTIMSAICGRAWNTSTGTGLNTYNLVVAPSGMGKDEMSKGINRITKLCSTKFPTFKDFFHFGNFASGQGLSKHFTLTRSSFAQIIGEFGTLLKKFANARDENMQGLMTVMLDLYSKSGPDSTSGSIIYSDATKNVLSIQSPAYSILGDTTPEVFESINAFLLNSGFISRFNIFEYKGARSEMNERIDHSIDPKFIDYLILLAQTADHLNTHKKGNIVATLDFEAQSRYGKFRKFCNDNYNLAIRNKGGDIEHHMWSRSLDRINVLSTLAAILDTPPPSSQGIVTAPIITEAHWDYFEQFVMNDINNFRTKQDDGDLGTGDSVQVKKLEKLLDDYLNKSISSNYRVQSELQASSKIPYSYIRQRMTQIACFRTDGNFDDKKLKDTIQTLSKMGRLKEIKDPREKGMVTGDLYWVRVLQ
jgi:hypothetical protein